MNSRPRFWPENTPPDIIARCEQYWRGTDEFQKFRITSWNDTCIITGYPSGAYYTNGGRKAAPTAHHVISRKRTETKFGETKPLRLCQLEGRLSPKEQRETLVIFTRH